MVGDQTAIKNMPEERVLTVKKLFNMIDKDQSLTITINEIKDMYDPLDNEDYRLGKISKEVAYKIYLDSFNGDLGIKDGIVTWYEFYDHFNRISKSIDNIKDWNFMI